MTISLFQIGNVAFHLHGQLFKGEETRTDARESGLLWSAEYRWPTKQYQPELQSQKIEGILLSDCAWSATQQLQRLKRLIGVPTEIIGYEMRGCCSGVGDCGCDNTGGTQMDWLCNYGMLKTISITNREDDLALEISLDIDYGGYWQPLSRVFWKWGPYIDQQRGAVPAPTYINYRILNFQPSPDMVFCSKNCNQFQKIVYGDCLFAYNPDLWVLDYCHLPPGVAPSGIAQTWSSGGLSHQVFADASVWGAPPQSIYAVRNLSASGKIVVGVTRAEGVWQRVTVTTTIDLALLNSRLIGAGYGGIHQEDILYFGDVAQKPGFVIRGNAIIDRPRPEPQYSDPWPGYLSPGSAEVDIGLPTRVQLAYRHNYRRL